MPQRCLPFPHSPCIMFVCLLHLRLPQPPGHMRRSFESEASAVKRETVEYEKTTQFLFPLTVYFTLVLLFVESLRYNSLKSEFNIDVVFNS